MAVPMYLLYEGGIVMSRLLVKNRMTRAEADRQAEEEQAGQ
jgi:Sec-independent protein secretion pathway component TatC